MNNQPAGPVRRDTPAVTSRRVIRLGRKVSNHTEIVYVTDAIPYPVTQKWKVLEKKLFGRVTRSLAIEIWALVSFGWTRCSTHVASARTLRKVGSVTSRSQGRPG